MLFRSIVQVVRRGMEIGVIVIGEIVREKGNENERGNEIEIGRASCRERV